MHLQKNSPQDSIKKLSVLIHQDGLSFYTYDSKEIIDQHHDKFKHQSNPIEILDSIKDCYDKVDFLDTTFSSVTLLYHHQIFTCVPTAIFTEDHAVDYLKYTTRLLETDTISTDHLTGLGIQLVYIAYQNINNYFFDQHGGYEYYHYGTRLLKALAIPTNDTVPLVHLEVLDSHFYLTIFKKGDLIAHNNFQHDAVEDILYYTMFTTHQNNLDPETMKMTIAGKQKDERLFQLLYTYVRHINYIEDFHKHIKKIICV